MTMKNKMKLINWGVPIIFLLILLGGLRACIYLVGRDRPQQPQKPSYEDVNNKINEIDKRIDYEYKDSLSNDTTFIILEWD